MRATVQWDGSLRAAWEELSKALQVQQGTIPHVHARGLVCPISVCPERWEPRLLSFLFFSFLCFFFFNFVSLSTLVSPVSIFPFYPFYLLHLTFMESRFVNDKIPSWFFLASFLPSVSPSLLSSLPSGFLPFFLHPSLPPSLLPSFPPFLPFPRIPPSLPLGFLPSFFCLPLFLPSFLFVCISLFPFFFFSQILYNSPSMLTPYVVSAKRRSTFDVLCFIHPIVAVKKFLIEKLALGDVYAVTISQALKWIQSPTTLKNIKNFAPWKCDSPAPKVCSTADVNVCHYDKDKKFMPPYTTGVKHYLFTCTKPCSPSFPWYGNPSGK